MSVYGKSKEAGERALRSRLPKRVVLRTSWVFGAHGKNFVKTIVRSARERAQISVVSDQFGGPTSARFNAHILASLAYKFKKEGSLPRGTYHSAQQPFVSWHEFAGIVVKRASELGVIGGDVKILPVSTPEYPTKAVRPLNSRLDSAKLNQLVSLKDIGWYDDLGIVLESLRVLT